jgi:hypothetical protein
LGPFGWLKILGQGPHAPSPPPPKVSFDSGIRPPSASFSRLVAPPWASRPLAHAVGAAYRAMRRRVTPEGPPDLPNAGRAFT